MEEIEIDLEVLQKATIRELARYAKMVLEQNAPASGMQTNNGGLDEPVPSKSREKSMKEKEGGMQNRPLLIEPSNLLNASSSFN